MRTTQPLNYVGPNSRVLLVSVGLIQLCLALTTCRSAVCLILEGVCGTCLSGGPPLLSEGDVDHKSLLFRLST